MVNVNLSINDCDVVIKSELEEVINSVIKTGNENIETIKELNNVAYALFNLGKYVERNENEITTLLIMLITKL